LSKILPRRGIKAEPELVSVPVLLGVDCPEEEPVCAACKGKGTVPGMFQALTCMDCHGTGIDLRYAVAVLNKRKARLEKAEKVFRSLKGQLRVATTPKDVLEREAMEEFYKDSKYNKYD
jgi:DnaJ-class molecular chaperone